MNRRFALTLTLATSLALSLACGAGSDGGAVTEHNYAARSARFGPRCDPFEPFPGEVLPVGDHRCLELILEGYYTEGTLRADLRRGDEVLGQSTVSFDMTRAVLQRLASGEAASRVTFSFNGPLPPGAYSVVVHRNDREVATYPLRVGP